MDIEEIKKLMMMMEERGVIELEIKNASGEIRLVRGIIMLLYHRHRRSW